MNTLPAPAPQASTTALTVEVKVVTLPEVCDTPFLMSLGFYEYGLPELMMCNLEVNASSKALMQNAVQQLHRAIVEPRDSGTYAVRLLTSAKFMPYMIQGLSANPAGGAPIPTLLHSAVRKLDANEERLLLAQLYEYGISSGVLTPREGTGIANHGISLLETADERNFLPGSPHYNFRRSSKINTVTAH
jgi:hypothetical protein